MYYVVVGKTAYALDDSKGQPYAAPVFQDGMIDWHQSYDLDWSLMDEDEQEYIAHIIYHLQKISQLVEEQTRIFVK